MKGYDKGFTVDLETAFGQIIPQKSRLHALGPHRLQRAQGDVGIRGTAGDAPRLFPLWRLIAQRFDQTARLADLTTPGSPSWDRGPGGLSSTLRLRLTRHGTRHPA